MDAAEGAAGVPKALAKWMRQRQGANFCSFSTPALRSRILLYSQKAGLQALAKWMRQRQGANFCPFNARDPQALSQ
jgi:hypothetical protein